ncbi:MAG: beta-propeller domain-containing protein, partial [Phycisphaerae bacterium]
MYRYVSLSLILALIPGCGLLSDLLGHETGSSELKAFESEKELIDYFSDQIAPRNDQFTDLNRLGGTGEVSFEAETGGALADATDGAAGPPPAVGEGATGGDDARSSEGDFSQTTIQEEGVDEADVVKTDGTYLYIIDNTFGDSVLRIIQVSPPEELALIGQAPLEGYGREIYLHDNKVVALTSTGGGFFAMRGGGIAVDAPTEVEVAVSSETASTDDDNEEPDVEPGFDGTDTEPGPTDTDADTEPGFISEYQYQRPQTVVTVVDVSAPDNPTPLSQTKFDGSQSSSRMIDGVLHLVISNYQDYYYDVLPMLGQPELDLSNVDVETLLPKYDHVDADGVVESSSMLTWHELYHPIDPDGFGVVTVVSLDVDNKAEFTAVGVVAEPGLIYSSLNALYLTDTEYDFVGGTRETTDIYKFEYKNRSAAPVATGSVAGRILNQYSMGEYKGHLRVATTVGATWSLFGGRSGPYNNVYVLGQSEEGPLGVVGRVENIAPGETIQSARFMGDRGYVVTFEQIDPLFTLDMSDPTDPRIIGELKVP